MLGLRKGRASWLARFGFVSALCLGASLTVAAGDTYPECNKAKPSKEDIEGAKGAHNAASRFYEVGEYDKAIRSWRDAYEFDCTAHSELLNIANAYEKKGDKQSAITALETYLARAKVSAAESSTINERIRHMKEQMTPPTPTVTASTPPSTSVTAPPTSTVAPSASASASAATPAGARPYGNIPLFVAAGGGAVLVVGAIILPVGVSKYASAKNACGGKNTQCGDVIASQGNSARTLEGVGAVMLGIGVVAAGGGLVWHLVFNKPKPAETTNGHAKIDVTPVAGPGQAGLVVNGKF